MLDELKSKLAPQWGLWAVLVSSIISSLTTFLPLYILGRVPFSPSNLSMLPIDQYYRAQTFFFPVFALAVWLLVSGTAHIVLRLSKQQDNFDQILNIVGFSGLIFMPVDWLWDWAAIALNWYQMTTMAIVHSAFAVWEIVLITMGLKKILQLNLLLSAGLAILIVALSIALSTVFVR
jgi:hypothetical protein